MARLILHAHRDGWETALNHPEAVVIDYPASMLRQGTRKFDLHGSPRRLAFLAFMLRGADITHARRAIAQAVYGDAGTHDHRVTEIAQLCRPALAWLGMTLETIHGRGLRLHSDPRETLPCNDAIAPSQLPPTRSRSFGDGAKASRPPRSNSSRISNGNAWKHTRRPRPSSVSSAESTPISNGPATS